jgi:hypothetical protein
VNLRVGLRCLFGGFGLFQQKQECLKSKALYSHVFLTFLVVSCRVSNSVEQCGSVWRDLILIIDAG